MCRVITTLLAISILTNVILYIPHSCRGTVIRQLEAVMDHREGQSQQDPMT